MSPDGKLIATELNKSEYNTPFTTTSLESTVTSLAASEAAADGRRSCEFCLLVVALLQRLIPRNGDKVGNDANEGAEVSRVKQRV
mmetsp:Transcript_1810/g.3416  ORF Transcript_1810/g.3416 Transcript_1810/m.3416 type:complete len:85 (+) Transcript_1810:1318-1572(+)